MLAAKPLVLAHRKMSTYALSAESADVLPVPPPMLGCFDRHEVEEKYGLTSEDIERAVMAHHSALAMDKDCGGDLGMGVGRLDLAWGHGVGGVWTSVLAYASVQDASGLIGHMCFWPELRRPKSASGGPPSCCLQLLGRRTGCGRVSRVHLLKGLCVYWCRFVLVRAQEFANVNIKMQQTMAQLMGAGGMM